MPTLIQLPTLTPRPTLTASPLPPSPRPPTHTLEGTETPAPTLVIATPTLPDVPATQTPTFTPTPTFPPAPVRPVASLPEAFSFGQSVEGRALFARRIGGGSIGLVLVGGIHGGYEGNTITLVEQFIAHFEANPGDVLPGIALVLIPSLNPDGAARGTDGAARFNANGVNLNRNWACGWQSEAFWRRLQVDPGPQPFSEPETTALAALIYDMRPSAVIFYHSAADGVYAGACDGRSVSGGLEAVLGGSASYGFGEAFDSYPVTGTAPSWVDGLGIPSVDVELAVRDDPEFNRNLRGVMAVQCWLLDEAAGSVAACGG